MYVCEYARKYDYNDCNTYAFVYFVLMYVCVFIYLSLITAVHCTMRTYLRTYVAIYVYAYVYLFRHANAIEYLHVHTQCWVSYIGKVTRYYVVTHYFHLM